MLCFYQILWPRRLEKTAPKSEVARRIGYQNSHHAVARTIRKSKSLKTGGVGALLEVERRKICTTLWREIDLKVKTVQTAFRKTLARVVGFLRVRNDAFRMACAGISCLVRFICLRRATLNLREGCKFWIPERLLCGHQFAWQLQDFVCLGENLSWQAQ